jgi:uroporphyrinogen III methyltransferase/synthase
LGPERPERITLVGDGPLFEKRVLVTRAAHQAEDFAAQLAARGALPVIAPAIEIGPPDDARDALGAIRELHVYAWVAFTSRNGVDAFFEGFASPAAGAAALACVKVAAIGSKTAQRLSHFGIRADLVPEIFVGEEIARALVERTAPGDRVLIFRAQEARDVLPRMLQDAGRSARAVAAYKTAFAHDDGFAEKVASTDVLTFASASSVNGFVALLGGKDAARDAARGRTVACVGPIVARAAEEAGLPVDVIGRPHTTAGLIEALCAHFAPSS